MNAVQQIIRILVIIILADHARCQDGYDNRDMLQYQHMAAYEGNGAPAYSPNILHRDPDNRPNIHFQLIDDSNNEYHRADRTRKVYRIKNPFQNQDENKQNESSDAPDVGTSASNQYASMQYSLPPEEFLQQMRAENQYYQQQTTPSPNLGYTATPQPQYQQYSTIPSGSYDNSNQQPIPQIESKSQSQYLSNNAYQFNPTNTFHFDSVQSTPSPVTTYLSTALPSSQYVGTASNYVSSSSPIFLSSPPNLQQYVSSPLSVIQTGSPDYSGNRVTTTIGSNSLNYDNNDQIKKMQIDHYDNSANGIRYPVNAPQQQYSNEYSSSTQAPLDLRDSWQNAINAGVNPLSKSMQELSVTQYQNYPYNNQQDGRSDSNLDTNSDTHRIGNLASANNIYLNYAQPDYQGYSNGKSRTRDTERDIGQPEYYSNGEYGWKLAGRKPQIDNDIYPAASSGMYQRYQTSVPNSGAAVSQMSTWFHMDTSRSNNYDQTPKSTSDSTVAQEFAKAAANAHEYMKQQQNYYGNNYNGNSYNSNPSQSYNSNPYYGSVDKDKVKYIDTSTPSPYTYSSQPDLITSSSPFYYGRENIDNKPKQPFDHAKALKAIVPIDVSNVVSNSEPQLKTLDSRFTLQSYGKDQGNQNQQLQFQPLTDSYYKDKNSFYGFNIKTRPDDYSDNLKQSDSINSQYILKPQQTQESVYNQGNYGSSQQRVNYNINQQNYQGNIQSPNFQGPQRPNVQPDSINSILKLNDVPYQLTQSLNPESFRFQNSDYDHGNLPTQLPVRINQDVSSHQLEVTSNILNKLLLNKAPFNNRPDVDPQANSGISLINGFKVANPFNMDLKMVAEILKGKSPENSYMMSLRDQYNKPSPLKLDLAQLQLLLKNENIGNIIPVNDGLSALNSPFLEIYNSGRYPYQGVKYSRSQEEEEDTIVPIADASHNHPIGAVTEQDDDHETTGGSETSAQDGEGLTNYEKNGPKKPYLSGHKMVRDRHRHANSLVPGRHSYPRKYPVSDAEEPFPLLKPPPQHSPRNRGSHFKMEKHGRRRRVKPRVYRVLKTEALFESENEGQNIENSVPTVLRPPAPVAEDKSDDTANIEETS